ncbi:MAG: hypothetical protein ABSC37_19810 [Xanthobacteraceae bacterium]
MNANVSGMPGFSPSGAVEIIQAACKAAGLGPDVARAFIAAKVAPALATKVFEQYQMDISEGRPRREDAYSLLIHAVGSRRANAVLMPAIAVKAPQKAAPISTARSRPPPPKPEPASMPRSSRPRPTPTPAPIPQQAVAAQWDEIVGKLNAELGGKK